MKQVTTRALGLTATLFGATAPNANAASVDAAPGFFFSTLPFNDSGTTVGAIDDIGTLPAGVSDYTTVAGPDVFYSFTVSGAGTLTFQVTPAGGFDAAIYLLTGGTIGTNAFIGEDEGLVDETETLTTGTLNPGTYYFVVDSFYSNGSAGQPNRFHGAYTLSVTGTAVLIPEPGAAALGLGALGAVGWRRRRLGAR
jgi:hypothetical protein